VPFFKGKEKYSAFPLVIMEEDLSGLANAKKLIGLRQVTRAFAENEGLRCLVLARDADDELKKKVLALAEKHNVKVRYVTAKAVLGKACNIDVSAAVVGLY